MTKRILLIAAVLLLVWWVFFHKTQSSMTFHKDDPSASEDGKSINNGPRDNAFGTKNDATDAKDATEATQKKNKDAMDQTN
ncbi:MAG TPA: hypothetical protein VFG11_09150 [Acidobacteriota bacterium]|nr:hypothetical protein [Acidobacteriota bacterium]